MGYTQEKRLLFLVLCAVISLTLLLPVTRDSLHAAPPAAGGDGVHTLTGSVRITNPSVLEHLSVEVSVGLSDMVAFVKRDRELDPPYMAQPMAAVEGDLADGATYTLPLPIQPRGALNDVSNGKAGSGSQGVQIYAVTFDTNFFGDAFNGPYESGGWPGANASIRTDPGTAEVRGGLLVVWAASAGELFPTGFGADNLLFTADDPVGPIPAGWTVVDLDKAPFALIREPIVEAPILEGDTGSVDLTALSYTEAFDALLADLRKRYALTEMKGLDFDDLARDFRPAVQRAERDGDVNLFKLALFRLADRFNDGHVSSTMPQGYLAQFAGGVGLTLGETSSGTIVVTRVAAGSAAAQAGIRPGAQITAWNGDPVDEAIGKADQPFTHSTAHTRRLAQVAFLARMVINQRVEIAYQNPGESQVRRVRMRAEQDIEGLLAAIPFYNSGVKMPIEVKRLPSGLGYIAINTFSENPQLLVQTWEWALKTFNTDEVPGLVIDLRANSGGFGAFPTYFAGSFFDEEFVLYSTYRADEDGTFVLQGRRQVRPAPIRWAKPVALLIGPYCASACEIFAAAVARNPKAQIVGSYPTYGVAAGLYGPWLLPGGIEFRAPVLQPQNSDGSIFLEGVGVEPTVRLPVTVESLLSTDDLALTAAEDAVTTAIAQAGRVRN